MQRVNLSRPSFTFDPADPEGFRAGMDRFGPKLGAAKTGASLYELPPGQAVCPYHYELGEEEWLLVLEGRPSLRTPDGTEQLEPLELAFFPEGSAGAHQIRNDTDDAVRVLMWSTVNVPTASVYPDSDKIGIWTKDRADNAMVPRSAIVDYYHGETGAAR
jgi:uncharacterized cupin superfamily protein